MPVPGGTTANWKRPAAPFEEAVALLVLLVFALDVLAERLVVAEEVDDDGMVDDEIDRHQRVDLVGIAAEGDHGVAHGGKIDDRRHAGEILHQHAGGAERDLMLDLAAIGGQAATASISAFLTVRPSSLRSRILQHDLHRKGQLRDAGQPFFSTAFSEKYS